MLVVARKGINKQNKEMVKIKTGKTYWCKCGDCGKEFKSDQIVELSGVTMGGNGDAWQEYVSPCCNADYEEIGTRIAEDMSDKELIDILETRGYAVLKEKEKNDLVTSTLLARLPRS